MNKLSINNCRICGLYMLDAPWGLDGVNPTYEICPCCGVEFGNEDYTLESIKEYRKNWLNNNVEWFEPKEKTNDWDLEMQLKNIPIEFI